MVQVNICSTLTVFTSWSRFKNVSVFCCIITLFGVDKPAFCWDIYTTYLIKASDVYWKKVIVGKYCFSIKSELRSIFLSWLHLLNRRRRRAVDQCIAFIEEHECYPDLRPNNIFSSSIIFCIFFNKTSDWTFVKYKTLRKILTFSYNPVLSRFKRKRIECNVKNNDGCTFVISIERAIHTLKSPEHGLGINMGKNLINP